MDAKTFATMLSDKHFFDLRRMQYKYGKTQVDEMTQLLYYEDSGMALRLPITDFNDTQLVYLPGMAGINLNGAKQLMAPIYGQEPFGRKAMEDEIHSTLSIEDIHSSRESIRSILSGKAPANQDEQSLYGMKQGLEFISDRENRITAENLHRLYQLTVGEYLTQDCALLPGRFYRHDVVYVAGGKVEHQGLPAAKLPEYMERLFTYIEEEDQLDELHKAAAIHFYLAYLHPYFDGNGRTARFVHLWYLVQRGYPAALHSSLSAYIQRSRTAYYKAFSQIEENAKISGVVDVTPFLGYFAENVYNKLGSIEKNNVQGMELFAQFLKAGQITQKEKALWEFTLSAYGSEEFSTKQLEKDFGNAAYATIRSFVLKFTELGLLQTQAYGNRVKYRVKG